MPARFYVYRDAWKRSLASFFDMLGDPAAACIGYRKNPDWGKVRKVLAARIDHLGDALLLRPVLSELRKARPDILIHVLTTPENTPVFLLDGFVDKVVPYPGHWFEKFSSRISQFFSFLKMVSILRREKYDAALDFRGDLRIAALFFLAGIPVRCGYGITGGGWMLTYEKNWSAETHQVILNRSLLDNWIGPASVLPDNPSVRYPESTPFKLGPKIRGLGENYIVIHGGAGNPQKEASRSLLAGLIAFISEKSTVKQIVLVGTAAEKNRAPAHYPENVLDLRGLTDLYELAYLFKRADLFIGSDSGPSHLAAAQGIPVAVLASKTNDIRFWHPWTNNLAILPPDAGLAEIAQSVQTLKPQIFSHETNIAL